MSNHSPIVLALLAGAAAPLAAAPPRLSHDTPSVTVQNDRRHAVTVDAELGPTALAQVPAQEIRLGTVGGAATASFTLPAWVADNQNTVQIYVRSVTGLDHASDWMALSPGEHVEVEVPRS